MYTIPWNPLTNAPSTTSVTRDADQATIPNDPANTDWAAFTAWKALGNAPTLAPAPPAKPQTIDSFTQMMALFTPAELQALVTATDPQIRLIVWQALSALPGGVAATDPRLVGWVSYIESAGILTQLRAVLVGSLIPPQ